MPKPYCKEFADVFNSGALPFPEGLISQIQSVLKEIDKLENISASDFEKLYDLFLRLKLWSIRTGLGNPDFDILIVGHENAGQSTILPNNPNHIQLGNNLSGAAG